METVERAALGSPAALGDMYDARADKFIGVSALRQRIPDSARTIVDTSFSDIQFVYSDKISEKFAKLNVTAELQVSVLGGCVPLKGSGTYLTDQKTSARSVRSSLIYNVKTKDEKLNIYHDEMKKIFSTEALQGNPDCTHIVAEVSWGADTLLTFEHANTDNHDAKEIAGKLAVELEILKCAISGTGKVNFSEAEKDKKNDLKYHFYGDVIPKGELPTSLESAVAIMQQVPSLLQSTNNGFGKPLSYKLIPISLLTSLLGVQLVSNTILKRIELCTLTNVVQFFEDVHNSQLEVNDFSSDALQFRYCLTQKQLVGIADLKNRLEVFAAGTRSKLGDLVRQVRAGNAPAECLDQFLQMSLSDDLSPRNIQKRLQTWQNILDQIDFARYAKDKGAVYIGAGVTLDDVILDNYEEKMMVLYFQPTGKSNNELCWNENSRLFFSELKRNKNSYKFFVVDGNFHLVKGDKPCMIKVLQGGAVLVEDLLAKQREFDDASVICWQRDPKMTVHTPDNLINFKIVCPGRICKRTPPGDWICSICTQPVGLGMDGFLYCYCGQSSPTDATFKCCDKNHGLEYKRHTESYIKDVKANLLDQSEKEGTVKQTAEVRGPSNSAAETVDERDRLYKPKETMEKSTPLNTPNSFKNVPTNSNQPLKSMNILLLGETGVGKSTWINGFYNFLSYDTLEEAEKGELKSLIPTQFTVYNDDHEKIIVTTGNSRNEVHSDGQSATQSTQMYEFQVGNHWIRIIDTPGVGDVRGPDQDKRNFENILATIATIDDLHGICILLKPNNSRLTLTFRFCVKELLTHLHRDACENIIFCFTNSRGTFYKPGDTLPSLLTLLAETKTVKIPCKKDNIFCYDSESYRFLAAIKNTPPVPFSLSERENFSKSWLKSIEETNRTIKYIENLKPHKIKNTISLNNTRQLVLKLTRPLAEINKLMQTNIKILEDDMQDLQQMKGTREELLKKRMMKQKGIDVRKIDHPKTVCSNKKCVRVWKKDTGESTNEYVTICHAKCRLEGVQADSIGAPELIGCEAMGPDQHCQNCGHSYREHLHVYYDSVEIEETVVNEAVDLALKAKLSDEERKKIAIANQAKKIEERRSEIKIIEKACAQFANFLKQNAITPYNDDMEKYLNHYIKEEEEKVAEGGNRKLLDNLIKSKESYLQEKKILDDKLAAGVSSETSKEFQQEDINKLVDQLLNLKHSGRSLREALDCVNSTQKSITMPRYSSSMYKQVSDMKTSMFSSFAKFFQK